MIPTNFFACGPNWNGQYGWSANTPSPAYGTVNGLPVAPVASNFWGPVGQTFASPFNGPVGQTYASPINGPVGQTFASPFNGPVGQTYASPFNGPVGQTFASPFNGPVGQAYASPLNNPVGQTFATPFGGVSFVNPITGQVPTVSYATPYGPSLGPIVGSQPQSLGATAFGPTFASPIQNLGYASQSVPGFVPNATPSADWTQTVSATPINGVFPNQGYYYGQPAVNGTASYPFPTYGPDNAPAVNVNIKKDAA